MSWLSPTSSLFKLAKIDFWSSLVFHHTHNWYCNRFSMWLLDWSLLPNEQKITLCVARQLRMRILRPMIHQVNRRITRQSRNKLCFPCRFYMLVSQNETLLTFHLFNMSPCLYAYNYILSDHCGLELRFKYELKGKGHCPQQWRTFYCIIFCL